MEKVSAVEAENARLWAAWCKAKEWYDAGSTIEAFLILQQAFDPGAPKEWTSLDDTKEGR